MAHVLLWLLIAIMVGVAAYGVTWIITGRDRGLDPEEPDGRAVPLPTARPLVERDVQTIRFDTALRGYRMDQVDAATKRAAYDIGYKEELIGVLEAELSALRAGEIEEADALRAARESAVSSSRAKTTEGAKAVFGDADDDTADDDGAGSSADADTVVGSITVTDLGEPVRTTLGARDKTRGQAGSDSVTATSVGTPDLDDDDDVADDEPAIRPGATEPTASDAPAPAASRR
jgi:DivIVA domain-containing protein